MKGATDASRTFVLPPSSYFRLTRGGLLYVAVARTALSAASRATSFRIVTTALRGAVGVADGERHSSQSGYSHVPATMDAAIASL